MSILLGSAATVIKPGTIKLVTIANPEDMLIKALVPYIRDIGYSEQYPNFSSLNVGAVHPFALLMFQEIQGVKEDLTVFPSITIADNSVSEEADTISDNRSDIIIEEAHALGFQAMKDAGTLFISDSNMTALLAATADGGKVVAIRRVITRRHGINLSIWTANRDVTSLLFELVMGFLIDRKRELKEAGLDLREISGSRTGDINMDFGTILFGASISVPGVTTLSSATADVDIGIVSDVQVSVSDDSDTGSVATTNAEVIL